MFPVQNHNKLFQTLLEYNMSNRGRREEYGGESEFEEEGPEEGFYSEVEEDVEVKRPPKEVNYAPARPYRQRDELVDDQAVESEGEASDPPPRPMKKRRRPEPEPDEFSESGSEEEEPSHRYQRAPTQKARYRPAPYKPTSRRSMPARGGGMRAPRCSKCGRTGHNRTTCY